jgi:prolyl 4-hydroxylase
MNRVQKSGVDLFTIDNFLNENECKILIDLIDANAVRSTTASDTPGQYSQVVQNRTSYTSSLHEQNNPLVTEINNRMSDILNIPKAKTETLQGQRYEVGQEFKDHFDWFEGSNLKTYVEKSGNRSYTFMVYLNDDLEGGETEFQKLNIKFKPKIGMAVVWKNLNSDGTGNRLVLHAGRPVTKGKKYILTRWFREYEEGNVPEDYLNKITSVNIVVKNDKTFSSAEEIPFFNPIGFEVKKVPQQTFALIKDAYEILKNVIKPERDAEPGNNGVLQNKDGEHATELMSMDNLVTIREMILDQLQPMHEQWANTPLIKSACYGIRSYKKGSFLKSHLDRLETHHISTIIIVDKKGDKNWPLDIKDHKGNWHKVYAEIGDMIMYESAKCEHGRVTPYEGEYFRNLFVHYKLKDWTFIKK